jgi:hypothetical protein
MSEQTNPIGVADFEFIPSEIRLGGVEDFDSELREFKRAQLAGLSSCRYPAQELSVFQAVRKEIGDFHLYANIDGELFDIGLLNFESQVVDRKTVGYSINVKMDEKSEKFIRNLGKAGSALMHESMRRAGLTPRPNGPTFKYVYKLV